MKQDTYIRILLTVVVLCLVLVTVKYLTELGTTKANASVTFLPALPAAVPTVSAPSKRNPAGFTARPFAIA
jgi:hypothetical protein